MPRAAASRNAVPPRGLTLAIASRTGGRFYQAQSAGAAEAAYAKLGSSLGRIAGQHEVTVDFAIGAAVLLVLAGVLAALWAPRLP